MTLLSLGSLLKNPRRLSLSNQYINPTMTIKIERLSIHLEKLKTTDITEYVFHEKIVKTVQNSFRAKFVCKVILVILLGLIFPRFDLFLTEAKAQMEGTYSQAACQEFLEPTNPAELK